MVNLKCLLAKITLPFLKAPGTSNVSATGTSTLAFFDDGSSVQVFSPLEDSVVLIGLITVPK